MAKSSNKNLKNLQDVVLSITKNPAGKVLIIARLHPEEASDDSELTWVFPGGKQEPGESLEDAVVRETKKETGYQVKVVKKISEREFPNPNVYLHYFLCEIASKKVKVIQDIHEVEKLKWVDPSELRDYFTTDIDPGVAKFLGI